MGLVLKDFSNFLFLSENKLQSREFTLREHYSEGEGFQSIMEDSSPKRVADVILKVINTSSPNVRYSKGKEAESVLKAPRELSDEELEKELVKNFKSIEERYPNLQTTQEYSEESVRQIVHEVLEEIKLKDLGKKKT